MRNRFDQLMQQIPAIPAKVFWAIVVLLHLLGWMQAWHTGSIYLVDSIDYLSQATNIRQHGSLYAAIWDGPLKPDYYTFRPPVYGIFILLIKSIINSDYAVLLMQSVLSISTLWGVLKLATQAGLNAAKTRFLMVLMLLCYPAQIIHCNFVMSDILFQSLLFWSFYFALRIWIEPSWKRVAATSLLLGLAMLTKPVAFLLGISLAAILMVRRIMQRKSLMPLLPILLLPLIYHGYSKYNEQVTGYYHYTSVTPVFVLKYMAKYTNGQLYGEAYADSVQEGIMQKANAAKDYATRYQIMNDAGKEILLQHPWFFAWFNVKGWMALMVDPGRFDWVHFLNMNEGNYPGLYHVIHTKGLIKGLIEFIRNAPLLLLILLLIGILWNIFTLVCLLYWLFTQPQPTYMKLIACLFIAYIMVTTGVLGLSRYRVAIAPLLWLSIIGCFAKPQSYASVS